MQGECFCDAVRFETDGDLPNLYQCHCSLCRKVTGASDLVWVPAGLPDGDVASEIAVHLHRGLAVPWERDAADGISFDAGPESPEAPHRALL